MAVHIQHTANNEHVLSCSKYFKMDVVHSQPGSRIEHIQMKNSSVRSYHHTVSKGARQNAISVLEYFGEIALT